MNTKKKETILFSEVEKLVIECNKLNAKFFDDKMTSLEVARLFKIREEIVGVPGFSEVLIESNALHEFYSTIIDKNDFKFKNYINFLYTYEKYEILKLVHKNYYQIEIINE